MQQLRGTITNDDRFAEVVAALQLEGRDLDADQLAGELHLDTAVVNVVEALAGWADRGLLEHEFASVCVATINSGSLLGRVDLTTFVFARRCDRGIELLYRDENGGGASLGFYTQAPSLLEMTVLVDAVLLAQSPVSPPTADWRDAYLQDETMHVAVTSTVYTELRRWYERSIAEWIAQHGGQDG